MATMANGRVSPEWQQCYYMYTNLLVVRTFLVDLNQGSKVSINPDFRIADFHSGQEC